MPRLPFSLPPEASRRPLPATLAPRPERPRISFGELKALLREDYAANARSRMKWTFFTPGFQAILAYRLGVWCNGLRPAAPARAGPARRRTSSTFLVRNFYGIELYPTARIGRRLRIAHQHGIVIHPRAVIGDDCLIRHGVTIGADGVRDDGGRAPVIGDRVRIGVGAVVAGADPHRRRRDASGRTAW